MVGSWVAIAGTSFGTSQGSGSVSFGGTTATVVSWSDTAIMVVVPTGLSTGGTVPVTVTTAAGSSNAADFEVASTAPAFNVSPQQINLLVGQTRMVSVTDSTGNALTGLVWTTSDPSVVSLSADDPPVLTAVAPGTAIVYVVGMPILVTVYSGTTLPAGTAIWSVPIGNGSTSPGSMTMAPAVPSSSGVDLITLDNSFTLTGLSADGTKVWKLTTGTTYGGVLATSVIPDFSGSALLKPIYGYISNSQAHWTHKVQQVNWSTGTVTDLYTFSSNACSLGICDDAASTEAVIPHPSGVVMIQDNANVSVIDPTGVQATTTVALDNSTVTTTAADGTQSTVTYAPQVGKMIVAGDGNAYVPYYYYTESDTQTASELDAQRSGYLMAMVVAPNGGSNKVQLNYGTLAKTFGSSGCETASGTDFYIPAPNTAGNSVITNADQGAAVFADVLQYTPGSCTYSTAQTVQMNFVSQAGPGSQVNLTGVSTFVPSLQREDGSYIGTDGADNVIALAQNGSVVWQYALPAQAFPQYATADGGAIVTTTPPTCPPGDITEFDGCQESSELTPFQSGYGQLGTLYTLDQNGNVTSQAADAGAEPSWGAQWYSPTGSTVGNFDLPLVNWETGYQSMGAGDLSSNNASVGVAESVEGLPVFALAFWGPSCTLPPNPSDRHKVQLSGDAWTQYDNLRKALILSGKLECPTCTDFFNQHPDLATYFSLLGWGLDLQVAWDGLQTNISWYDAGGLSAADVNDPKKVEIYKGAPVCGWFVTYKGSKGTISVTGRTAAASQVHDINGYEAHDVYINTNDLQDLSQGTILHEVLHNLTGLYDDQLEKWLGLDPKKDCPNGSICITNALTGAGCAGK